jgi:hypothetical protein
VEYRLRVERLEARDVPAAFQSQPILPFDALAVLDHARAITLRGHSLGRDPASFLKLGDSNSSPFYTPEYLAPLGAATYNPYSTLLAAAYPSLLSTWSVYHGGRDSLAHEGPTAFPGWRTDNVLSALEREIRATNPSVALVMIGTNDAMVSGDAQRYRYQLTRIVTSLLNAGVVPILSTLPDSHYRNGKYEAKLMEFNQVIANVAGDFVLPLWNAWRSTNSLANHGLKPDGVHLNVSPNGGGSFWPPDLLFAQNVRNLQALQILDWFQEHVVRSHEYIQPQSEWKPLDASRRLYAVGRDAGCSPTVDVYDADTGELVDRFLAFVLSYSAGVRVAMGDTNFDGFADIVCATSGPAGVVKVISGADGSVLAKFSPFAKTPQFGLRIAVGDLNGDDSMDIVVARTGSAAVRVYEGGSYTLASSFRPSNQAGIGGVSVAIANVEAIGPVIAVSAGTAPIVRLFDSEGQFISSFRAFDGSGFTVTMAAVDLDGDDADEIAAAPSVGINRVRVFDPLTQTIVARFAAGSVNDPATGLRLGTLRSNDGNDSLLVGNAPGATVSVLEYINFTGISVLLPPDRANRAFGLFVG